jgi:modified peptide precursor CbpA
MKHQNTAPVTPKLDVIAYRKACRAEGVGLSHYILIAPKPAQK